MIASIDDPSAITPVAASAVFDALLEAMLIENCAWQPEVVAALLAERPAVVPGWGFGYRGAGESYSVTAGKPLPGIRADDRVTLRWATRGDNPENPFEQSDGRDYLPHEELVADLAAGDWLEYEMSAVHKVRVLDAEGRDAPVSVVRTERGIRVVAESATSIARIIPSGQ